MIRSLNFDINELTIVSTANNEYLNFIEPFITFCNESNPKCNIELWADEPESFNYEKKNIKIHKLPKQYNAATYRYILEPTFNTKYVYISDIDIMHTEYIQPFHLMHMQETNLPFSNVRRNNKGRTHRMSGLHFVEKDTWYKKTKTIRNIIEPNGQDEEMLFKIVSEVFDIEKVSKGLANRPIHGIHCSVAGKPRNPYSSLGWEITSQKLAFFENVIRKHGTFNRYFEEKVCIPLFDKRFIDKIKKNI